MNRCNAGKRLLHGNKRICARCMINKEGRERGTVPFFIYLPSLRLTSVHFAEHRAYSCAIVPRAEIFVPIECCGSANVIHSFLPSWDVKKNLKIDRRCLYSQERITDGWMGDGIVLKGTEGVEILN